MKDDFIVPLNGLAQGRTEFFRSVGKEFFASFGNSEILDADLTVEVEDWKSAGSIFVDCSISGKATVTCDRCLNLVTFRWRQDSRSERRSSAIRTGPKSRKAKWKETVCFR